MCQNTARALGGYPERGSRYRARRPFTLSAPLMTPGEPGPAAIEARIRDDPYAAWLGIEVLELAPGHCKATMRLTPQMVNFHGLPHGGAIFSLADYVFSGACNAEGRAAVALSVTIQFLAAAEPGARLTAEARAERQGRRAGFYAMTVTDDRGTLIASCQAVAFCRDP
jgi:acyl-CoA thioesterase